MSVNTEYYYKSSGRAVCKLCKTKIRKNESNLLFKGYMQQAYAYAEAGDCGYTEKQGIEKQSRRICSEKGWDR